MYGYKSAEAGLSAEQLLGRFADENPTVRGVLRDVFFYLHAVPLRVWLGCDGTIAILFFLLLRCWCFGYGWVGTAQLQYFAG